jgi:hypothetical protein
VPLIAVFGLASGLAVAIPSYPLSKLGLDRVTLYLFLKNWKDKHRDDTPDELHEFFEEEHRQFSESKMGIKYIIANTGRVMSVVSGAIECHNNEIL